MSNKDKENIKNTEKDKEAVEATEEAVEKIIEEATGKKTPKSVKAEDKKSDDKTDDKPVKAKPRRKPSFNFEDLVLVKSGFPGLLNITLKRAGYDIVLTEIGDEAEIEFGELRLLRNEHRGFFENNWLLIDDVDVIEALDVGRYYKKSLDLDGLETLFEIEGEKLLDKIRGLNEGQKKIVTYMAFEKINSGELDSRKVISDLEDVLEVELIER